MTDKKDGGPVFPSEQIAYWIKEEGKPDKTKQPVWKTMGGLTVRQYYAAHALQGLLAGRLFQEEMGVGFEEKHVIPAISEYALSFADYMISAEQGEWK